MRFNNGLIFRYIPVKGARFLYTDFITSNISHFRMYFDM